MSSIVVILRRLLGGVIGMISILGAYGAWSYAASRETDRYLVSALVLLCAGIVWFASSLIPRYQLLAREYGLVAGVLILGLLFGLLSVFHFCGGECNGYGFCHWYHGYPGRWFRTSGCGDISVWQGFMAVRGWSIDVPSLLADLFFWSGAAVVFLFVRKTIRSGRLFSSP